MKITITTQILDGNLGDGWKDNYEAAKALAEFTKKTWRDDLSEYANHEIYIDINVEQNCVGASRDMMVSTDSDDYEIDRSIELALTDEDTIWERFCGSKEVEECWGAGSVLVWGQKGKYLMRCFYRDFLFILLPCFIISLAHADHLTTICHLDIERLENADLLRIERGDKIIVYIDRDIWNKFTSGAKGGLVRCASLQRNAEIEVHDLRLLKFKIPRTPQNLKRYRLD